MNRQEFLQSVLAGTAEAQVEASPTSQASTFDSSPSHRAQRKLIRTTTGIDPIASSQWTVDTAAHLLRRTTFGARRSEILALASVSLEAAVSQLLADLPDVAPPRGPSGEDWVNATYNGQMEGTYRNYLKAWWIGVMVNQAISIREKMVLFWHNHFANEAADVNDARAMYKQNALFRKYAIGNFKTLVKEVTLDPAMLVYLNGYLNRGDGNNIPDENYARELFELFTIGKGPQIADGDYTNYTEQDVKAASRVLTGYRTIRGATPVTSFFDPARHDVKPAPKQFSHHFGNRIIATRTGADGARELDDLLDMIFEKSETARFICRKFYRWFVYYDIDENVERNVIEPLAQIMIQSDFEVKPVLEALLKSQHFYDYNNVGCYIQTPLDFVVGKFRQLNQNPPDLSLYTNYALANRLRTTAANLGMDVFDPPDVAGWKAYYQLPDFYKLWINTTTLPTRGQYSDALLNGIRAGSTTFRTDPIAYARTMSNPADPFRLIDDLASELSPISLTAKQKEGLMYDVMGLVKGGEYEWTQRWRNEPPYTDTAQNTQIITRSLSALLRAILRMAEAQLA